MTDETKIARLTEIQDQIAALTTEGVKLADECKVVFDLSGCDFTEAYGAGGMTYMPEGAKTDRYGDEIELGEDGNPEYDYDDDGGWQSSGSGQC